jgi:multiple sugar transport system permease protein
MSPPTPVTRRSPALGSSRGMAIIALAPFLAFLLVFALYPLAELVRLAVTDTRIVAGAFVSEWAGPANFSAAWTDPVAARSAGVTIAFVVLCVGLTIVLGLALALLVDRAVVLVGAARTVLIWPAVVAPVVVSTMWLLLLSPTVGGLNKVLSGLGLPTQGWLDSGVGAFVCIVVVDVWHWTPVVFLFVYTALRGVDREILEAARIDGAGEWQVVGRIILPIIRPAILAVALVRLVMSIKAFDEMYLLTRGGPGEATNLISLYIRALFFDRLAFGPAAALSISIVAVTCAVVGGAVAARRIRRRGEPA